MASPQSNTVEDFFNTKSGVINEFGAIGKRLMQNHAQAYAVERATWITGKGKRSRNSSPR